MTRLVATIEPERSAFAAATVDAAIAAQVEARLGLGLPPHAGRLAGWTADAAARTDGRAAVGVADPAQIPPRDLARYAAAAHADDVDAVPLAALPAVSALASAARTGRPLAALLDVVQCNALTLCVWPPSTVAETAEARSVGAILERTVRRRRPFTAAVLCARVALDPHYVDRLT